MFLHRLGQGGLGRVEGVGGVETTMMNCKGVKGFALRTLRTTPSFRMTNVMHHGKTRGGPTRLTSCPMMGSVHRLGSMSMTVLTAPAHDMRRCTGRVLTLKVGAMSDFSVRARVADLHHSLNRATGTRGTMTVVSTK